MKKLHCLAIAFLLAIPVICQSGCGGTTAQEKAWEQDIPQVPPGDRAAGKAPPKK